MAGRRALMRGMSLPASGLFGDPGACARNTRRGELPRLMPAQCALKNKRSIISYKNRFERDLLKFGRHDEALLGEHDISRRSSRFLEAFRQSAGPGILYTVYDWLLPCQTGRSLVNTDARRTYNENGFPTTHRKG